jgi:hypothetical protein
MPYPVPRHRCLRARLPYAPDQMEVVIRAIVFATGTLVVALTVGSAVRTVVLPRGVPAKLASFVFVGMRQLFRLRLHRVESYEDRDRVMAIYAPLSLLMLALAWLVLACVGYAVMLWALGAEPLREAFSLSGSSLLTLGFSRPSDLPQLALALTEALLGLTLAALLITYLPTLYTSFSRREAMVTRLEVRAGTPPSGVRILEWFAEMHWLDELDDLWTSWEGWFVELEETHTSLPALVFFRSPQPDHSWLTAAGAVLDSAALGAACLPERHPRAEVCVRGYLALRRIADFFGIPYERDPDPEGPITVARDEFDTAYDRLAAAGIPVVQDREHAWRDFVGWRVNYDAVLVTLAGLVMAPYAPWSSDRSAAFFRVKVLRRPGMSG